MQTKYEDRTSKWDDDDRLWFKYRCAPWPDTGYGHFVASTQVTTPLRLNGDWHVTYLAKLNPYSLKGCGPGVKRTPLGGLEFLFNRFGRYSGQIGWEFDCRKAPADKMKCCYTYSDDENYKWDYLQELKKIALDCEDGFLKGFKYIHKGGKRSYFTYYCMFPHWKPRPSLCHKNSAYYDC